MKRFIIVLFLIYSTLLAFDQDDYYQVGMFFSGNTVNNTMVGGHLQYSSKLFDSFDNVMVAFSLAYGEGKLAGSANDLTEAEVKIEFELFDDVIFSFGRGASSFNYTNINEFNNITTYSITVIIAPLKILIPSYNTLEYRQSNNNNSVQAGMFAFYGGIKF